MKKENNVTNYGWKTTAELDSHSYIAPKIIQILKGLEVKRLVDLGSGNGFLCSILKKENFEIVGIEPDVEGYNLSVKKYPNIKFFNMSVESKPDRLLELEKKFDAVVSTEVIEHLYSPHLLPIFSNSIIKEGGFLIISTPYHGYFKNLALSLLNHWDIHHDPLWHGGHIKFWSNKTLTRLLIENNFIDIKFYGVGRFPLMWKSMILVARRK